MILLGAPGCCEEEGTPVTGVTFNNDLPASATTDDSTFQLTWTVSPADADDSSVTFQSSNASVLTVNSSGIVSYTGAGDAYVTVTTNDGSFTDTTRTTSVTVGPCDAAPNPSVQDPSFDTGAGWTLDPVSEHPDSVRISGGQLILDQADAYGGAGTQISNIEVGCPYRAGFSVASFSSSGSSGSPVALFVDGEEVARTSAGTSYLTFTASSSSLNLSVGGTDHSKYVTANVNWVSINKA